MTLTPNPAWNEKFSSYSITGANLTGNTFTFTNSDVTANANYETAKNVTTATDGHGTITASPKSGFTGTVVTLSNTPNTYYNFTNYSITGANLTGNKFTLTGSDVTAKANFSSVPHQIYVSGILDEHAGIVINDNSAIPIQPAGGYFNVNIPANNYVKIALIPTITQFGNQQVNTATLSEYSDFYDYHGKIPNSTNNYSAEGLKKEITITAIYLGENMDVRYASSNSTPYTSMYPTTALSAGMKTNDIVVARFEPIGYSILKSFDDVWFEGYTIA